MVKPLYDSVVIKEVQPETKTAGGIILTAPTTSTQYNEGEVLAVGHGYKTQHGTLMELTVKVGDIVLYRKGTELKITGEDDKFIISEAQVIAIKQ